MKDIEVYQTLWKKYLPVISMKLKQVVRNNESAHVGMYKFEFHSSGKKKKSGYQFDLNIRNGRVINDISSSPVAAQLSEILRQDPVIKSILNSGYFNFTLNSDFILTIQQKSEQSQIAQ